MSKIKEDWKEMRKDRQEKSQLQILDYISQQDKFTRRLKLIKINKTIIKEKNT